MSGMALCYVLYVAKHTSFEAFEAFVFFFGEDITALAHFPHRSAPPVCSHGASVSVSPPHASNSKTHADRNAMIMMVSHPPIPQRFRHDWEMVTAVFEATGITRLADTSAQHILALDWRLHHHYHPQSLPPSHPGPKRH